LEGSVPAGTFPRQSVIVASAYLNAEHGIRNKAIILARYFSLICFRLSIMGSILFGARPLIFIVELSVANALSNAECR
jgi:hypothetical protein